MEVVHFMVRALLTVERSRLEAAFADPGSAFQCVLPNCLRSILDGYGALPCVRLAARRGKGSRPQFMYEHAGER